MRKPGERIGSYELIRRIGRGGMAEVFLARRTDDILHKDIVIKLMHSHLAEDERFIKMFLREARIAARMNHTNVVQVLEVGNVDDEYYLAMEYLDGASLQSIAGRAWKAKMTLPLELCARAIGDSALGLHYAHSLHDEQGRPAGLVHRDISPDNLFVTRTGVTKVLDFGIATGAYTGRVTRTGELKGKVRYMSPEQIDGLDLDARSDIFSLGVTSYRLLTGHPPFDGTNELQCMRAVMEVDPPPPSKHNPHLPRPVDDLVMSMLEKDKEKRASSGEEIYEVLSDFDGGSSGRRAVSRFLEQVLELPMSNKLDVPTWVTSKRPAAAPAAGTLSGPVTALTPPDDDPPSGEEPAESSQPATADLGEAAAAMRSRVATQDTVVAKVDLPVSDEAPPTQEAADSEKTLRSDVAPAIAPPVSAADIEVPPVPGASGTTPVVPIAAAAVVLLLVVVGAVFALGGEDEAAGVRVSQANVDPSPSETPDDSAPSATATPPDEGVASPPPEDIEPPVDEAEQGPTAVGAELAGDEAAPTDDAAPEDAAAPSEETGEQDDVANESGDDAASGDDAEADEAASDDTAAVEADPSAADKPTERRRRARRRSRTTSTSPKAAQPTKATLVFRVVPYGVVSIDGRELGTTPLAPYEVSAGRHNVLIKYKDKTKHMPIRVKGGERKVIRANMTQ